LEQGAGERQRQWREIAEEQERIRGNMAALDRDSALYRRYVDELDQQETRLKALRAEADQFRSEAQALGDELRAYLDTLEVE
jgi:hypothetical protein